MDDGRKHSPPKKRGFFVRLHPVGIMFYNSGTSSYLNCKGRTEKVERKTSSGSRFRQNINGCQLSLPFLISFLPLQMVVSLFINPLLLMTEHINAVLFYLAGKNYFNGTAEMNKALDRHIDYNPALDQIEAIGLVHTKTEGNRKVYVLKQYVKDGIQNIHIAYSQDPYGYFKQLNLEKQRIITQHKNYVGSLTSAKDSNKQERKGLIKRAAGMAAGVIAALIVFLKLKRR
jgi:hypothetical protein